MIVISDASPLTNLATIGKIDLLRALFERVLIPPGVAAELRAGDAEGIHVDLIALADWVEVRAVFDRESVDALMTELDLGEAEAIVLAEEAEADLLLMDERIGRAVAAGRGIRTIGLLGALVTAKRKGVLPRVKPVLDALVHDAGFWVSDSLYEDVLRETGE
ncbi:MAG: DUF3368 domain-containing protein [Phycisphaerales bacterium]|nr:DUF3368 domain-containing protein [Phycisphaerales bacterium]